MEASRPRQQLSQLGQPGFPLHGSHAGRSAELPAVATVLRAGVQVGGAILVTWCCAHGVNTAKHCQAERVVVGSAAVVV